MHSMMPSILDNRSKELGQDLLSPSSSWQCHSHHTPIPFAFATGRKLPRKQLSLRITQTMFFHHPLKHERGLNLSVLQDTRAEKIPVGSTLGLVPLQPCFLWKAAATGNSSAL